MEPLVAGPPFVRALQELVAAAKLGSHDGLQCDPASARAAFWKGQCGMALTWPTRAADGLPGGAAGGSSGDLGAGDRPNAIQVGFAELPGSRDVYNVGSQSWENRPEDDDPHVPLLGVAGRAGVVGSSSKHPGPAFQLLLWLSGKQFGQRICATSPATTLFRLSQAKSPQAWVEQPIPAAAAGQYAATTQRTLMRQQWLSALRIPGRAEYLSALDEAVGRAARGERSAAEALRDAAARWRDITQQRGLQSQKSAYLQSLGLAD
ncbi:MAG: hypothetical protein A2V70_14135 [Planctomycetes bacterium RBG_13_63_9]|nr:MAG: hypothetical protein A2V70_14135 [Planctomycetes bacterium RBG_13_63_9]